MRYDQTDNLTDLTESVAYDREALSLRPVGQPDRGLTLANLSVVLDSRYRQTGDLADLADSIVYGREALSCGPNGHVGRGLTLSNLSAALEARYRQTADLTGLTESIEYGREALSLCPIGRLDRGLTLSNLSVALNSRYNRTGDIADITESITSLKEAATDSLPPLAARLSAARYRVSIARINNPASLADAYSFSLALLDRSVLLARNIHDRHARLTRLTALTSKRPEIDIGNIAVDAASWAIDTHDLEVAVQLLEQGKSMTFNQLGYYRTPMDDLDAVDKKLADRFRDLSAAMELFTLSNNTATNEGGISDDVVARCVHRYKLSHTASSQWHAFKVSCTGTRMGSNR